MVPGRGNGRAEPQAYPGCSRGLILAMPATRVLFGAVLLTLLVSVSAVRTQTAEKERGDSAMREMRKEAAHRQRRIIFNNDGNDAVYQCEEPTVEELLSKRTTPLVGTQCDTIFYCPWSAGFGQFTHNSQVAEVFTTKERIFSKNITADLIDQGTDPLQVMVDFCKAKDIEIFWSMRMNDVHDGALKDGDLFYPELFPQFKRDHPEFLVGTKGERLPGVPSSRSWAAVDYGRPEVRERAFRIIQDVCERYELDGIELDFFRHLTYFRSHAQEGQASESDLGKMTALLRRVRAMTEDVAARRGRPLLIAVRVPDSVEHAKIIGLDWERWLAEDLVDILVASGYFRLRPWSETVELGHSYGVPVYAGLSESRIKARKGANSRETYRARAMNAWLEGVDGIYLFNYFNPRTSLWSEIGDPETLAGLDKTYWATARGPNAANSWVRDGDRFGTLPTLCPNRPVKLAEGKTVSIPILVGEDLAQAKAEGIVPDLRLRLQVENLASADDLAVTLNGEAVAGGVLAEGWLEYTPNPDLIRRGINDIEVTLAQSADPAPLLHDLCLRVEYKKPE